MKKFLLLISAILLLQFNTTFALTQAQEEAFKPQIEKTFKIFEKNIEKFSDEDQIQKLDVVVNRIDNMLKTRKFDDTSKFIISYLNVLIEAKLNTLKREVGIVVDTTKNNGETETQNNQSNNETSQNEGDYSSVGGFGGVDQEATIKGDTKYYEENVWNSEYNTQRQIAVMTNTKIYSKSNAVDQLSSIYSYLQKGIQKGVNDAVNPDTGKTLYQEQIDSYNTAIGYWKDGKLFNANISSFNSKAQSSIKAFQNPLTSSGGVKGEFKKFQDFGYRVDETTGKVYYDPNLNEVGPNLKYFEY